VPKIASGLNLLISKCYASLNESKKSLFFIEKEVTKNPCDLKAKKSKG
jgi:hypothetical protein